MGFVYRDWNKIFLVISDLVAHYGEIINSQFTGIYPDLPQSLSSVGVEQDPEELALLIQSFYPLADLLDRLITGKHIQLDCAGSCIRSDKEIHFYTLPPERFSRLCFLFTMMMPVSLLASMTEMRHVLGRTTARTSVSSTRAVTFETDTNVTSVTETWSPRGARKGRKCEEATSAQMFLSWNQTEPDSWMLSHLPCRPSVGAQLPVWSSRVPH